MTQLIRHTIFVKELQSGGNVESDEVIEALIERSLLSCTCIVANVLTQPTSKRPTVEKCLLTCQRLLAKANAFWPTAVVGEADSVNSLSASACHP